MPRLSFNFELCTINLVLRTSSERLRLRLGVRSTCFVERYETISYTDFLRTGTRAEPEAEAEFPEQSRRTVGNENSTWMYIPPTHPSAPAHRVHPLPCYMNTSGLRSESASNSSSLNTYTCSRLAFRREDTTSILSASSLNSAAATSANVMTPPIAKTAATGLPERVILVPGRTN